MIVLLPGKLWSLFVNIRWLIFMVAFFFDQTIRRFLRRGMVSPFARRTSQAALFLALFAVVNSGQAQAPWSGPLMQRGIAAVTCGAPVVNNTGVVIPASSAYVFGLVDIRTPLSSDYAGCGLSAPLWNAPMYHDSFWTAEHIGNVFGITLDLDGNIYLAAHGLYGTFQPLHYRYGNLGGGATDLNAAGTVYRIDAVTGAATVFAVIPGQQTMVINSTFSSGPGLGNIAYDRENDQFFVSSLEDGKIYRLDSAGTVLNSFDPLTPDDGSPGMPPRSERVWAVEVSDGGVFYSIWNNGNVAFPGVIRRVALTGTGDFDPGSDAAVLTVPPQPWVFAGGTPVSDITFSLDGQTMIIGTRTMQNDTTAYNHASATHMAVLVSGVWTVVGTDGTGCNAPGGEAYGGVALGEESGVQESIVWTSAADMAVNYGPHGLYGVRVVDFPVSGQSVNSFKVPYDPSFLDVFSDDRKGSGGDIEIMRVPPDCMVIEVVDVECPERPGEPFTVVLDITNLSNQTAHYVWFTATSSLPSGAITAQPSPSGIITLPTPLAPNASTTVTVTLPSGVGGETVCFRVTLLNEEGDQCCTDTVCVVVPPCDCARVLDERVECEVQEDGTIKYTITLTVQNLTHLSTFPSNFAHATFLPPAGFSPTFTTPTPDPIVPGGVGTIVATYYGTPGTICFNLGLHNENLEECCSLKLCIDLPDCPPANSEPDTCRVETKVPCHPSADGGPGTATLNYTICNNSTVPRTYSWTANGAANPSCSSILTSAHFSPSSGTLGPIPPGGCMSVPITVLCEGLGAGDCAGFQISATYNDLVPALHCEGIIYERRSDWPVVDLMEEKIEVAVGEISHLPFRVENPTDAPMTVEFLFRDSAAILGFSQQGSEASPFLYATLMLEPFEVRQLVVDARRFDDGFAAPNFTSLEVSATTEGAADVGDPVLIIPVRLLPVREGQGDFAVRNFQMETSSVHQIMITIPTVTGRRYQIEEAQELSGPWVTSECTTPNAEMDAEGFILGTGREVECYIVCDPLVSKMFFRAVEYR